MDGAWRRPTDSSLCSGIPSVSEVPSGGARALWLLWGFSKVTRRQGGTLCSHYRSNGYVHNTTVLTARQPSRASPLPQFDRGRQLDRCRLAGRHRRQASSHSWILGRQVDKRRLSGRHGSKLPRHRFSTRSALHENATPSFSTPGASLPTPHGSTAWAHPAPTPRRQSAAG